MKLIVMAAGLGSRYGGLKQMDNMTSSGEIILDFACFDAIKAGFKDIVFVIKPEMEDEFNMRVVSKIAKYANVQYVFQDMSMLPGGMEVPAGRVKPWGTCHAVLAAKDLIDGPFAVINSDDYYGADAFRKVHDFLQGSADENEFCMAGYSVENTLSDHGTVTRGVCNVDAGGYLSSIDETKNIGWVDKGAGEIGVLGGAGGNEISARGGDCCEEISARVGAGRRIAMGTPVSMNFWGFKPSILAQMETGFSEFLSGKLKDDPMNAEYPLPVCVEELLESGQAKVKVLDVADKWYGVTYKEDKAFVSEAFERMKREGKYPEVLWG